MTTLFERFLSDKPRRSWTITLISAQHLQDVRKVGKMKVYAVVSDQNGVQLEKTVADTEGKTNPQWNYSFSYEMGKPDPTLMVKLYCERFMGYKNKFVCEAKISVKELIEKRWSSDGGGELLLDLYNEMYPGTDQGKLKISCSST